MKLKEYVVIKKIGHESPAIWTRAEWETHINWAKVNSKEPLYAAITAFDATEELKEGGGMSSDQAVMAFAHHMNKQRGYETVHGTMYYNDADSDKPLTAIGIAEQWIQSQTGEQFKEG